LLTSKGFATRAARDLLALIGDTGEPITFYCIHDADGPGTVIHEALAQDPVLAARVARVVNLGLEPAEGRAMGLEPEPVERKEGRVPVAGYVPADDREWLQRNRIELNAMTTPQFLAWLDAKMAAHGGGKVVPPAEVVRDRLAAEAEAELTRRITEDAVRAANVPDRVRAALAGREAELGTAAAALVASLPADLDARRDRHWSAVVRAAAVGVIDATAGSDAGPPPADHGSQANRH
jgi:hypothetical protein